jgi:glycosyltransferase involved in cell wall biosynthesis
VKVGVLVVAYNAESTLRWVLDRIPLDLRAELAEVLVLDDHSSDSTFDVAHGYLASGTDIPITIIRHDHNLGYGGNQKAGYRYAIDHGWDVVVLLHGDGQYAPEKMADLLSPIVDGDADAVFGSRMLDPGGALRGGMPRYKYVGNRILTTAQNAITGARLSEWHSGYRAYRVMALADLPLVGNSDDFDFDTEIILQLLGADKRIVEVPIPTYYGDEISRVNGIAYARDIMIDTVRHRLGEYGFGRGDLGRKSEPYEYKPSPNSSHAIVLELVPVGRPLKILDVGCGPGWVAAELRRRGHHVTGVDVGVVCGAGRRLLLQRPDSATTERDQHVGGTARLDTGRDVNRELRIKVDARRRTGDHCAYALTVRRVIYLVPQLSETYVTPG